MVLTLEHIEDRLKASSMTLPSSVLTLRASLCMYLLGLSGFLTRSRGAVFAEALDLARTTEEELIALDRCEDPYDPIDSRRRSNDRFGVHDTTPWSAVLAVAFERRRCK